MERVATIMWLAPWNLERLRKLFIPVVRHVKKDKILQLHDVFTQKLWHFDDIHHFFAVFKKQRPRNGVFIPWRVGMPEWRRELSVVFCTAHLKWHLTPNINLSKTQRMKWNCALAFCDYHISTCENCIKFTCQRFVGVFYCWDINTQDVTVLCALLQSKCSYVNQIIYSHANECHSKT